MSKPTYAQLESLCLKALQQCLRRSRQPILVGSTTQAVKQLVEIVSRNLGGRYDHFARLWAGGTRPALTEYIERVVENWLTEAPRVQRLNDRSEEEWGRLYKDLEHVARQRLARDPIKGANGMSPSDYAVRTCERILQSNYPFDIPFDAWARTILLHLIFETSRSGDALDQPHASLDQPAASQAASPAPLHELLGDPVSESALRGIEDREQLSGLIAQLKSAAQRDVMKLKYFEGMDDDRIARKLGKKKPNIQLLHHRALERLSELSRAGGERKGRAKA